jgi:hypothetical protein
MRPKQYKLLVPTFAVQVLLYTLMVIWGFPTWAIWSMLLPLFGYAVALYGHRQRKCADDANTHFQNS